MPEVRLAHAADVAGWRAAARALAAAGVSPEQVRWRVGDAAADLLGDDAPLPAAPDKPVSLSVPRRFVELAESALQHRDPARFDLLYRLLRRIQAEGGGLLDDVVDPLVMRVNAMAKAVRRDAHKMTAFVRFREVAVPEGTVHLAWFEPDHHVLDATAPFFVRRFGSLHWSIVTPDRSARWDGAQLAMGPGGRRSDVPRDDAMDEAWRIYYASIFNPARLKIDAMRAEMPKKYWHNLPEARLIGPLIRDAAARAGDMIAAGPTAPARRAPPLPAAPAPADDAGALAAALRACRDCPLAGPATQAVAGEGPSGARVMLVGEQPGDQEDLAGRPFVGPAGQLLDRALAAAGLDRRRLWLTNAVKHFKFTPRGKRRIHQKPGSGEIAACAPWLARELALVRPRLVVALGGSAAQALLGRPVTVGSLRGTDLALPDGTALRVTTHPSYLLRIPDAAAREAAWRDFVADLTAVAAMVPEARGDAYAAA